MSLGQRLLAWFDEFAAWLVSHAWWKPLVAWTQRFNHFVGAVPNDPLQTLINQMAFMPVPGMQVIVMTIAAFTDKRVPFLPEDQTRLLKLLYTNPTQYFVEVAKQIGNNPAVNDVSLQLGDMIVTFVIAPLNTLLDSGKFSPEGALRLVLGRITAVQLSVTIIATAAEVTGLGQLESIATMLAKLVDTLDLPGIAHQIIMPITRHGYEEFAKRYYYRHFRPGRFTPGDYMALYGARRITAAEFGDKMAEQGYPNNEIDDALYLAEQRISVGDALDAYNLGSIGVDALASYIHARGYSADSVDFIIRLNDARQKQSDANSIAGVALAAFRKSALSEAEFRRIRAAANVPQDRIDLEVQIATLSRKAEQTDLSTGNIHTAYLNNVLARVEADKYLTDNGVDASARAILLATWDEEKAPKPLRLNSGTIVTAMITGVLTYDEALKKLTSLNWTTADANVILEVARKRMPSKQRPITEFQIVAAFTAGLITYDEALGKLAGLGLSDNDAKLVLELETIQPQPSVRELSEARVIKLYALGIFDEQEAIRRLVLLGYNEENAHYAITADTSGSLTSILTGREQT